MKVLKKGPGIVWSKKLTCTAKGNGGWGCGSELLVEHTDLYHTYRSFMDGSDETYVTFACPECGKATDVENYDGPPIVKKPK